MFHRPSPLVRTAGLAAVVLLAGQTASHAAVLARYEFTDGLLVSTDDDVADLTSTASDLSDGPGFTSGNFTGGGNPAPARSVTVNLTNGANEADAHTAGDYFLITITPAAGYQINLTSITMDFAASYNTQPRGFGIRTSVDTFGAAVGSVTEAANTGTASVFVNREVDLSGASLQGITGPVTLRITVFDNASVSSNSDRFDNITVNGTATLIPEPGTTTLAAVAGALALAARRRKRIA